MREICVDSRKDALNRYQNADNSSNDSFYLVLKSSSSSSSIGILRSIFLRGEEENNYFKGTLYYAYRQSVQNEQWQTYLTVEFVLWIHQQDILKTRLKILCDIIIYKTQKTSDGQYIWQRNSSTCNNIFTNISWR